MNTTGIVVYCRGWIWSNKRVVVSNMFHFHLYLGKIPILTNIFQLGCNHQLDKLVMFPEILLLWLAFWLGYHRVRLPMWSPNPVGLYVDSSKIHYFCPCIRIMKHSINCVCKLCNLMVWHHNIAWFFANIFSKLNYVSQPTKQLWLSWLVNLPPPTYPPEIRPL